VGAKEDAEVDAAPITAPTWKLLLLLLLSPLLLLPPLQDSCMLQGSCMLRSSGWLARATCSTKWRQVLTRIAAAVEEQSVTTGEIGRNIAEATTGSAEIAENIVQVARAAQSTAEGAANTQVSSQELSRMAQALQRLVEDYRK
jgi:hypothetical protein